MPFDGDDEGEGQLNRPRLRRRRRRRDEEGRPSLRPEALASAEDQTLEKDVRPTRRSSLQLARHASCFRKRRARLR